MQSYLCVFLMIATALAIAACGGNPNPMASAVTDEPEPVGKLVASANRARGAREVKVSLRVTERGGDTIAAIVSVSNLSGRILGGWVMWVAYDESLATPVQYRSGEVVGTPEDNYGLGGFGIDQNPTNPWKVAAASITGARREGVLFTLIFQVSPGVDVSRLGIGIEKIRLDDERALQYSVAVVHGRVAGGVGELLPGDVNGDGRVNITDAAMINAHLQGGGVLTEPWQVKAADYNQDGVVDEADAQAVAHKDLGL